MHRHDDGEAFRSLELRPATADDTPFLMSLFASTRSDELALLASDRNQQEAFIAMQFNAQTWQYNTRYPQADHSLILWNDAPIGRTLINRGAHEFTLVDIALLPAHRGSGIGTYLLQCLFSEATKASKPIKLSVWHSNPAKRLYERMGFSARDEAGVYCEMWWNPSS
ncbi:MAG: GNAT family N-acetyltransferase [Pyrinomonadaceae bacterium]